MSTIQDIQKQKQALARLEQSLALQKIKVRKADTRKKIELGNLVLKSNMNQYHPDIILGALIDAFERLENDSDAKVFFETKGQPQQ